MAIVTHFAVALFILFCTTIRKKFAISSFCNYFRSGVTKQAKYKTHKETATLREAACVYIINYKKSLPLQEGFFLQIAERVIN
jgi:hypothetical protein